MKLPAGLIALGGLALCGVLPAQVPPAQMPHAHGVASLDVQVVDDRLDLRLRAPLASLAGMERPPRTERQRQAVRRMAATLHVPGELFVPTAAADCSAEPVVLRSDVLAPALLLAPEATAATDNPPAASPDAARRPTAGRSPGGRPTAGGATAGGEATGSAAAGGVQAARSPPAQADLEAQMRFRCAKPHALNGLQVRLFDAFPALREIGVTIATPRGDSGVRLSPSRTSLTW